MGKLFDFILDFFYPNRCPFCDKCISYDKCACNECLSKIEHAEFCSKCGHHECGCKNSELNYDGCATLIPYISIGRQGILALKYDFGMNTAKALGPELARKLSNLGFLEHADILTAVPMTSKRRYEAGYNHAELIAIQVSKMTGIPTDFNLIKRTKSSVLQHTLGGKERSVAAEKTYYKNPKKDIKGKTVILCDDIITTGSTLNACARVLKEMGAKRVYCGVLAGSYREKEEKTGSDKNVGA